ncbi:hypothetical protein AB0903_31110 [Streptomyces sp. NPDC048389]|uniref:hypothetical protein n=1 Tax=Streptomyces sp. NPDC048389 TaxID=3154622 RepID=UPI003456AA70
MTGPVPELTEEARLRLESEWWPDGTFGGARHPGGHPARPDRCAAEHLAELAEAIGYRITPRQGEAA